jgi:hypothetical protein
MTTLASLIRAHHAAFPGATPSVTAYYLRETTGRPCTVWQVQQALKQTKPRGGQRAAGTCPHCGASPGNQGRRSKSKHG